MIIGVQLKHLIWHADVIQIIESTWTKIKSAFGEESEFDHTFSD